MIHLLITGIEEGEVGIGDSKELIDVEVNTEENINRQQPAPEIEKVRLVNLGQSQDSKLSQFPYF